MNNIALDTNVLMYLYDFSEADKRHTSERLLSSKPFISTQVISEFLNVTKRLQKLPKSEILVKCTKVVEQCSLIPMSHETMKRAVSLIKKYDFQLFASIIIASALEANCRILYSEDMQHNQLIENRLTIINPFL